MNLLKCHSERSEESRIISFGNLRWGNSQRGQDDSPGEGRKRDCARPRLARIVTERKTKETKQWQHELDRRYGKAH